LLILTRTDVERLLPIEQAIEVVRVASAAYSAGAAIVPIRGRIATGQPTGEMLIMPAYLPSMAALGVKLWSRFELASGVLTSAVMVFRDLERQLDVIMDAGYITDIRTGAMSGLACQYLAAPGAERGAVIGAGIQARTQLQALIASTAVREVSVWSRTSARAEDFVDAARKRYPGYDIRLAPDARTAIETADVVLAATTSDKPVVDDGWVKAAALVCGIGSHTRESAEIDPRTVARAEVIVVDTRSGGLDGAGDIAQPLQDGRITRGDVLELGEILSRAPVRAYAAPAIFKSVGFAALDVAAARSVTDAALAANVGQWINLH
jgi:ornithine cyclodeaminase/alanine dehydrogenase-like protein (mu-crystallin family)